MLPMGVATRTLPEIVSSLPNLIEDERAKIDTGSDQVKNSDEKLGSPLVFDISMAKNQY